MSTPETSIPAAETAEPPEKPASTWYLTRFVLLRFLGFVYAVAFLIAALQILPLIGEHGIELPMGALPPFLMPLDPRHCLSDRLRLHPRGPALAIATPAN